MYKYIAVVHGQPTTSGIYEANCYFNAACSHTFRIDLVGCEIQTESHQFYLDRSPYPDTSDGLSRLTNTTKATNYVIYTFGHIQKWDNSSLVRHNCVQGRITCKHGVTYTLGYNS